jgi:PfaD family protein
MDTAFSPAELAAAVARVREQAHVVREPEDGRIGLAFGEVPAGLAWLGTLPPLYPEWLGDRSFGEAHGTRFAYCTGAMANGIATVEVVLAAARAGCLGFFGAAGLAEERVAGAIDRLEAEAAGLPWGVNLIHSPQEPALEAGVCDLLIRRGVQNVEASAFMGLTPPLVRAACAGLRRGPEGEVLRARHVFAKVSRPEVARRFMAPPPAEMLASLVREGKLSAAEADLARSVPLVGDVTVEADSGGHTDNRPLPVMLPAIREVALASGFAIRVGAAGGLGTPAALASAFGMGAAYVLTGSINQACVESGVSDRAREMLAKADVADVAMAPAADMFEMGVEVQVLKRGSMFASRAHRLREVYRGHGSLEEMSAAERAKLEKETLGVTLDAAWAECERFWSARDPAQLTRASRDARHRMALIFRWYLGKASRWAIDGDGARVADYQLWCGPAMGAFNAWSKGSFFDDPRERTVGQVALNLLEGAAVLTRAAQLRTFGAAVPSAAFRWSARKMEA